MPPTGQAASPGCAGTGPSPAVPAADPRALSADRPRYALLDAVRGATVVAMVLFHLVYDLVFIYEVDIAWFRGTPGEVWEIAVGWSFVAVAGCSAALSHSNGRRACKLGLVALGITAVTGVVRVDIPIYFGVIHCLAACAAVVCLFAPKLARLPRVPAAAACLALAVVSAPLQDGFLQILPGVPFVAVPDALYRWDELAFLGLPGPSFASGDYFPLLPHLFVYLFGYFAFGALEGSARARRALQADPVPPLALLGRHSLGIYLVHQVVLIAVLALVFRRL